MVTRKRKAVAHAQTRSADQLEFDALRGVPVPLDFGQFDEHIASDGDDLEHRQSYEMLTIDGDDGTELMSTEGPVAQGGPRYSWGTLSEDTEVSEDISDLLRRAKLLGAAYPFKFDEGSLMYSGSDDLVYEFLLASAVQKNVSSGRRKDIPPAFERLVGRLASAYLGTGSQWYRLGWPPQKDRPKQLREAVQELHARTCGDWLWDPHPARNSQTGPRTVKDGGIDLVVWKPFGDNRIGQLYLLGQCACGNDWPKKLDDLQPQTFQAKWLRTLSHGHTYVRFMAVPYEVSDMDQWRDVCDSGNVVMDRIRLTKLAAAAAIVHPEPAAVRGERAALIRLTQPDFDDVHATSA